MKRICAHFVATAVVGLALTQAALATPVGLLESLNVEVLQGGTSLYSFNVNTTGRLDGQDIPLGVFGATNVSLRVTADQRNTALVDDRWFGFAIRGTTASGDAANLFDPAADGAIEVRLTNMKFDNVQTSNFTRVAPFHPDQYAPYPLTEAPLLYMLDEYRGFVNFPGSEKYGPSQSGPYNWFAPSSVQVPMRVWADPAWGYGFDQVDNGILTGFSLSAIPDFGGAGPLHTGALGLTPVLDPPVWPYFGPTTVPDAADAGFASEIGINLNMRAYELPEPATVGLLALGFVFWRTRRRRVR